VAAFQGGGCSGTVTFCSKNSIFLLQKRYSDFLPICVLEESSKRFLGVHIAEDLHNFNNIDVSAESCIKRAAA